MGDSPEQIEAARQFKKFLGGVMFVFSAAAVGAIFLLIPIGFSDPELGSGSIDAAWLLLAFLIYSLFTMALGLPGFWLGLMFMKRVAKTDWLIYPSAGAVAGLLATLILLFMLSGIEGVYRLAWPLASVNFLAGAAGGLSFRLIAGRSERIHSHPTSS